MMIKDIKIKNCPIEVNILYYESANEGNGLVAVKKIPILSRCDKKTIIGSELINDEWFDEKYYNCRWWNDDDER